MINSEIRALFATPIYITKLKRDFSSEENQFTNKIKSECHKNAGNYTSNDTNILSNKQYSSLRKELNKIIKDYFNKVLCSSNIIKPYITQSWLNYTDTNQFHHIHRHANSLVSGIVYMNADKNNDTIEFQSNRYNMIEPEAKKFNMFNTTTWWFPVDTGEVFLFPSSLSHYVNTKKGTNTRISLAFNVFIKGTIGSNEDLTELTLT